MTSLTSGGGRGGRLTPGRLEAVLTGIGEACGLDVGDARLIKFTNSAVFDLPRADVVVKIAGSQLVTERIPKVVRVARWLEAHDIPAVRLLRSVDQPVHAHGHAATLWQRLPRDPDPLAVGDGRRVGAPARSGTLFTAARDLYASTISMSTCRRWRHARVLTPDAC